MNKVFIIAEAGVNHNGDMVLAKKLIDVAVESGADAVKFQTFRADSLAVKGAVKSDYQKQNTDADESSHSMLKRLELSEQQHVELMTHARERGILFLSTPFDLESVKLLDRLGLEIFKIPSGEITNLPYLRAIGGLNKQVILSTGMANLGEIEAAIDLLVEAGTLRTDITVLHANTEYPTPFEDVNLRAMRTIASALGVKVGYSDHTQGIEVDIAAVALGAAVIEKHFTLDKTMDGPDHKASLAPEELAAMVHSIRNIEKALGTGVKKASPSESKNIVHARKSIVAARAIGRGEMLTEDNMTVKRPADGISPMRWNEFLGKRAEKDYQLDEKIEWPLKS